MSYIGAEPTTAAFPFDQFTGNGTTTAFTLTYAPAGPTSIVVAISGVVQNPNLYSVIGTTLTFSPAPPAGTNNIAVLYLGLPVIGSGSPGNTAFLSSTDLTATAGQTVFASAGAYTPGFVQVYRNGARLGNADFTATNGTTITLASAAAAGDLVTIEYYTLTSLVNALPLTGGTVTGSVGFNSGINVTGRVTVAGSGYTLNPSSGVFGYYNGGGIPTAYIQMPASGQIQFWNPGTSNLVTIDSSGRMQVPNQPSFLVLGTNYTQTSGGESKIIPSTESFDIGSNYDLASGRFTAPVSGVYTFGFFGLSYPHAASDVDALVYYKNGATVGQRIQFGGNAVNHQSVAGSINLNLSANDYVELFYASAAGTATKAYGSQWMMHGQLIG